VSWPSDNLLDYHTRQPGLPVQRGQDGGLPLAGAFDRWHAEGIGQTVPPLR
jgi:hypothetical protein